jgi:hypothetical protein
MASTRNNNNRGDYCMQQWSIDKQAAYQTYKDYAVPEQSMFSGDGLVQGRMGSTPLAYNYTDIESDLLGIGSTNLVKPLPALVPHLKTLKSLNIIDRLPVVVPVPLQVACDQRQYPMK